MAFYDPEIINPAITPFSQCPYCKKLIRIESFLEDFPFEEKKCPHCEIYLEIEEVINGLLKNFSLTQACTSANKIASFDLAVIPFVLASLLGFWMELPVWFRIITLGIYLSPIIFCVQWFRKHYWQDHFSNEEYNEAVKSVKKSLLLWIFTSIFCLLLLIFS